MQYGTLDWVLEQEENINGRTDETEIRTVV